jgi:putative tricarboxylic transport membrane protein
MKKTFLLFLLLSLFGTYLSANGVMDNDKAYPSETITIIVPFKAGGGMDTTARTLASVSQEHLGVPVVVVNRTGGSGTIAASEASRKEADGYTVFMVDIGTMGVAPLSQDLDYSLDDFDFISGINVNDIILISKSDSPYQSIDDLAKSTERIRYGTTGVGGILHSVASSFVEESGLNATNVPFGSTADTVTAVLGGHIEIGVAHPNQARSGIADGTLKVLGAFSDERVKSLPDVPTMKELGYDIAVQVSNFCLIPKGADPEVLEVLRKGFVDMLNDPVVKENAANRNLVLWPEDGAMTEAKVKNSILIITNSMK